MLDVISFAARLAGGETITIDAAYVDEKLGSPVVVEDPRHDVLKRLAAGAAAAAGSREGRTQCSPRTVSQGMPTAAHRSG
jgi:hypothetical protein